MVATSTMRVRGAGGGTTISCGSEGYSRNRTPSPATISSVATTSGAPPIQRVAYAPATVAGTPNGTDQRTMSQSTRP